MRFKGFRHSTSKKIHVVFFVDASEPKTITFSSGVFKLLVTAIVIFFGLGLAAIVAYTKQATTLISHEAFIRELKSGLVAYAASERLNPLFNADIFQTTVEEIKVASLLKPRFHKDLQTDLAKQLAESNKINSLDNATLSLAAASGASEETDDTEQLKNDSQLLEDKNPDTKKNDTVATPSPISITTEKNLESKSVRLRFQDFELTADPDRLQGLVLSFNLVNSQPDHPLSGKVCAVAVFKSEGSAKRFEPVPASAGVTFLNSKGNTNTQEAHPKDCIKGEPVRFSRLRPTEIELTGHAKELEAVTLLFVESGSKSPYSTVWANNQ